MKKSRIARPIAAVESPAVRCLPLVALLVDTGLTGTFYTSGNER